MDRKEWLAWRQKGIGGSDAACIHNVSPYKSAYDLWCEKTGDNVKDEVNSYVQNKGHELELIARQKFAALYNMEHQTDEEFAPRNVENGFMRASLDGASRDLSVIVEFKYQGKEPHAATEFGEIPKHYWIQVQHQLLVSGAKLAYFVSFDGVSLHTVSVPPDEKFMAEHLKKCEEFWDHVTRKKPVPLTDQDYKTLRVNGLSGKVQKWKRLKVQIEEMTTKLDELRDEILTAAAQDGHPRLICSGVKIILQNGRAGSIDYSKIPELKNVDLEKYRKPTGKPFYTMKEE